MKKTNALLLCAVVALFGYVTLHERFSLSTSEVEDRGGRVLPELVGERLRSITVEREGARYVLTRGARDRDGNATYRLTAPIQADGAAERVTEALSTIEWAEPVRTLGEADAASRRRYRLASPALRLRFAVADRTLTIAFGGTDPTGAGRYAEAEGKIYVVASEVAAAFDQPVDHYRSRELGEVPGEVDRVRVVTSRGEVRIARAGGELRMSAPYAALASEGRVNVLLATLRTMEAVRFVDDAPRDLARYGLAQPAIVVEVAEGATSVRLIVGDACDRGSRHARLGEGPVVCVAEDDVAPLAIDPRAYLETRASATEVGGVKGVDLNEGDRTLSVRDDDGIFHFQLGDDRGEADPEAVEEWIESLRSTRAIDVRPYAPGFAPTITLTVHRTASRPDDVVRFARAADGTIVGRRGEEGLLLVFPAALAERLVPTTAHVRDRALVHADPGALESIAIERPSGREVLRRAGDTGLAIVEPVQVAAEVGRVADLATRLAGLEAVRFVADAPQPEHGLASPRFVVSFVFSRPEGGPITHRLLVGAPVDEGGAYARLDDSSAVFVLVASTVELVATPLASRQELFTESLYVDGIDVRVGAQAVQVTKDGAGFRLGGAALDAARGQLAWNAVADLRATEIAGYGAPDAESGLARPSGEIRVRRAVEAGEPREMVLTLGATVGEGEAARVYLRRGDRPVTYLVAAAALEPILALGR